MVVRRLLNRDRRRQSTPELALRFARLCELAPIHHACIRGTPCHATTLNEHCAECNDCIDSHTALVRHFKLPAILLNDDFEPPSDEMSETEKLVYWSEALEEAVEEARAQDARIVGRRRSL